MIKLKLMFREYCGLCHQMRDALKPYQEKWGFELEIIEIDDFPELELKYNELVPVLLDANTDTELFHWHFNQEKLINYLNNHK